MVDWSAPASEASTKRLLYELGMGILVALSPAVWLIGRQTISWTMFGLGAFAVVSAYGVSRTALGRWVDNWFVRIGKSGRFVAICLAALGIWGSILRFSLPTIPVMSFVAGSVCVLLTISLLRLLQRIGDNEQQHPA